MTKAPPGFRAPRPGLAWVALILAGLLPACGPAPANATTGRPLLLLGGRVFANGDRCAQRLQEMLTATGVAHGPPVRLLAVTGADPAELARSLAEAGPAVAAVVIVGDLSLMDGIDPNAPPIQDRMTSRRIDWEAFDAELLELEQTADRSGIRLLLATPPLGIQGRVEVPELLELARHLRQHGPVLDLQQAFAELEPGPLFLNGIDVLDDYGQDALADLILRAMLRPGAPVPPLDGIDARTRELLAALWAWGSGDDQALREALERGSGKPPSDARLATLEAAVASAAGGFQPSAAALWRRIEADGQEIPGLALGRLMAGVDPPPTTGFEAELLAVLQAIGRLDPQTLSMALQLSNKAPQRVESWMLLRLAGVLSGAAGHIGGLARSRLHAFDGGPVSQQRSTRLLSQGVAALSSLPALLVLGRPFEDALVTGPALRAARRKARVGLPGAARAILDQALAAGRCPDRWRTLRDEFASATR